jgi:signal transduction histidine kinase
MGNHGAASTRARVGAVGNRAARSTDASSGSPRLMALSDWPVSSRLFAVIALALVMGLVFGGLQIAAANGSATQYGRVLLLANLGQQDTILIQDLQNERDQSTGLTAGGSTGSVPALRNATNAEAAKVLALAAGVNGSYPTNIQASVAAVRSQIASSSLANLRTQVGDLLKGTVSTAAIDGLAVVNDYEPLINDLITLNDEIAQGTSDSSLAIDVRELNLLSLAKDQSSQQRGLFFNSFTQQFFSNGVLQALISAQSAEQSDEKAFTSAATPGEQNTFKTTVAGSSVTEVLTVENYFFIDGNDQETVPTPAYKAPFLSPNISPQTVGFTTAQAPATWYNDASQKLDEMQAVELGIAQNTVARAQSLQQGAQESALVTAIIVAIVFLLVLVAAVLVARSLALPLRRLRASALDIATVQLPDRVKRLSEAPEGNANLEVAPIDVLTADEIGQVARAFDQVHSEAVRLAGNEAMLRASFNAMFVNLSRRSQSLIERLARVVDSLEQNEDDPERLSSLFSMDHLVTRMRRNSENLLLLAGHEDPRKWSEPVTLADVVRAAASEIEHYSRVVLNIQPGVAVIGQAVSDVVHLLAELIENATMFSSKDTQVMVSAQELNRGGVLIEITDKGIGITDERLAEMNWRLENPPVMDVSLSRHMGLFAVARLAERHEVRIRLCPASPQGLSALVWLPDTLIEHTAHRYAPSGRAQPQAAQGSAGIQGRRSPGRHENGDRDALAGPAEAGQAASGQAAPDWFRRRRIAAMGVGAGNAGRLPGDDGATGDWQSTARSHPGGSGAFGSDPWAQGRHAAEIAANPVHGNQTSAGLPVRIPNANLIPGSAGDGHESPAGGEAALPQRSPETARNRLGGFQQGSHRAERHKPSPGEGADS